MHNNKLFHTLEVKVFLSLSQFFNQTVNSKINYYEKGKPHGQFKVKMKIARRKYIYKLTYEGSGERTMKLHFLVHFEIKVSSVSPQATMVQIVKRKERRE